MRPTKKTSWLKLATLAATLTLLPQLAMAVYVPEDLKPWVNWALHTHKDATCPMMEGNNQRQCAAYGNTLLDIVTTKGTTFQMTVKVEADDTQVILPGQTWAWPENVVVNNQPKGTGSFRNMPALRLNKGTYLINGTISWENTPAYLQLPEALAQLTVRLNGKPVDMPQLRGNRLILQKNIIAPIKNPRMTAENTSKVQVFRLVTDANPATITTNLRLTVTGAEREITIPDFHLAQTEPASYSGRLPVKRLSDGSYTVQVTPGVHTLTFTDRFTAGRLTELAMPNLPWEEEVWAFNPIPELRLVDAKGDTPLNPDQTDMPNNWRNFAAYLMHPGEHLNFDIVREGAPTPPDNNLTVQRTMWLAQNGHQFTVRDALGGTMNKTWRLDIEKDAHLGRVDLQGKAQPLTQGADGRTGVEIRQHSLNMVGTSILPVTTLPLSAVKLPIGAWNTDFSHANAQIILPTAWRPLAATGVQKVRGTWLSQWNLYQFFFLLLTTALAFRLWGSAKWAAVSFVALALTMHDHRYLLSEILVVLVFTMVLGALPEEAKLASALRKLRGVVLALLVLFMVPFTLLHLQNAVYPHLAKQALFSIPGLDIGLPGLAPQGNIRGVVAKTAPDDMMMTREVTPQRSRVRQEKMLAAPAPMAADAAMGGRAGMASNFMAMEESLEMDKGIIPTADLDSFDPNTRVPTGPGVPEWRQKSNTVSLNWPEGVTEGRTFRLWMLSPFGFRLLEILKVLFVGLLLARLFNNKFDLTKFKKSLGKGAVTAATALLFLSAAAPAHAADFPTDQLLKELERRLLEPAPCAPNCAFAEKAAIEARGNSIRLELVFTAEEEVLAQLPTLAPVVFPSNVVVNDAVGFTLSYGNRPYVRLPKGRSVVRLHYNAGDFNNLTLDLQQAVGGFDSRLAGWRLGGLNNEGQPNTTRLSLSRTPDRLTPEKPKDTKKPTYKPLEFAGYARVTRELSFANTWQVTTRIALENGSPFTLDLPLLEGEHLLDSQYTQKEGKVRLQVTPRQIVLHSEIAPTEALKLVAAEDAAFHEIWQLRVSPKWHVAQEGGIAPIMHLRGGIWSPEWQPYPGDSLTLSIKRPKGVEGQDLTIHSARVETTLRGQTQVHTLVLNIETTRPQTHNIELGKGVKLKEFRMNGISLSEAAAEGDKPLTVGLPLRYGSNMARLVWEETQTNLAHVKAPAVDLKAPFVNATQTITGLRDRWIVWAYGPAAGPYVKLWSVVLGMLVLAWAMAKVLPAPLSFAGWFILALGFSQSDALAFLLPVGWLLLLQWREQNGANLSRLKFNLTQVSLIVLSLLVVSALFAVVKVGLLGTPEIYVEGNFSNPNMLQWFQDTGANTPAAAGVCTLPMWVFRLVMMAWALWSALWLMRTFKWAWHSFTAGGYWRKKEDVQ